MIFVLDPPAVALEGPRDVGLFDIPKVGLVLPADAAVVRIFRSVAFLGGAGFSAAVGYLGMNLAVQANLRVAAAAESQGRAPAMHIGFRTGATVGMLTVGLACWARASW